MYACMRVCVRAHVHVRMCTRALVHVHIRVCARAALPCVYAHAHPSIVGFGVWVGWRTSRCAILRWLHFGASPSSAGLSMKSLPVSSKRYGYLYISIHIYTYLYISIHIYTYLYISIHIYKYFATRDQFITRVEWSHISRYAILSL